VAEEPYLLIDVLGWFVPLKTDEAQWLHDSLDARSELGLPTSWGEPGLAADRLYTAIGNVTIRSVDSLIALSYGPAEESEALALLQTFGSMIGEDMERFTASPRLMDFRVAIFRYFDVLGKASLVSDVASGPPPGAELA
jgi:hypothetical protein